VALPLETKPVRNRPFGRDEGLVVRAHHQPGILPLGQRHQRIGGDVVRVGAGALVPQRLGGEPVLAVAAMEVAAQHAEGERVGAGEDVEERLLLDRVALERGDVAAGHQ